MPVVFARCAASRATDQVENPYPSVSGLVSTARRIWSMNWAVARPGRPGGLIGASASTPPLRYRRRTRVTVSALFDVPKNRMALGLGIHGEPGIGERDIPSADELASLLADALLADVPPDRRLPSEAYAADV